MRFFSTFTIILTLLSSFSIKAQQPFSTIEYVDIGNVKAGVLVHGDMLWDPANSMPACEFPKGSGVHAGFLSALWMSGYDGQSQLHASAQTFRQTGNDFWPGPLDNSGSVSYQTSENWARIWKVSFLDINKHLQNSVRTQSNTPKDILEWPAKGNPYAKGNNGVSLSISDNMAPFVDVNSDGTYNALNGDYPAIKGDQMLWWVFSDDGPTHDNIPAQGFRVQVKASAYGYARGGSIDNIVYFNYELTNKSVNNYTDFRIGILSDIDLGYFRDDYIGFDSVRRLGFAYNGIPVDGSGQTNSYGSKPPIAGFAILQFPGDVGTNYVPVGSFMTYNNDATVSGNPQNATEYSNYMRSRFRDGQHLVNDYMPAVPSDGRGAGSIASYIFPGDPSDTTQWSECSSNNPVGDRRFVISSSDIVLNSNSSFEITWAMVITDTGANNTCPGVDITSIKKLADTSIKNYVTPPKSFVSVVDVAGTTEFKLFPNPVKEKLNVLLSDHLMYSEIKMTVTDVTGRNILLPYAKAGRKLEVDTYTLPAGTYLISIESGDNRTSQLFRKE